ncbi:MAG: signal peptidase I, partial [Prevotellaceae bacterium]|nr:signal peptidase I [Prevotellaceae bacterium]
MRKKTMCLCGETNKKCYALNKKKSIFDYVLICLKWALFLICTIIFAIALRVFLLASFLIPTYSMAPTILPGDFILVNKMIPGPRIFNSWDFLTGGTDFSMRRLKGYRKVQRNEILVFNFPYSNHDKLELDFNVFYAKRCIAIPGDTFYIDNGIYKVKNVIDPLGYYPNQTALSKRDSASFHSNIYRCFPSSLGWNIKNYGQVYIPGENDTVAIDTINVRFYEKLIEYETGQSIEIKSGQVFLDSISIREYVFQQNYYFMAGD